MTHVSHLKCRRDGHDLTEGGAACKRCGLTAEPGFRLMKRPIVFSPFTVYGDGLGELGPVGVWYIIDKRLLDHQSLVACAGNMTDALSMSHTMADQEAAATAAKRRRRR